MWFLHIFKNFHLKKDGFNLRGGGGGLYKWGWIKISSNWANKFCDDKFYLLRLQKLLPYETQIGRHLITSSKVFAITVHDFTGTRIPLVEAISSNQIINRYLVIGKALLAIIPLYSKSILGNTLLQYDSDILIKY